MIKYNEIIPTPLTSKPAAQDNNGIMSKLQENKKVVD